MYSFRAFAGSKASWMLNYSWDGEKKVDSKEAMKNLFAAQLMAGSNSWDAKGHVMSGSNDMETRKTVFQWIASHENTFYRPRSPIHPIGVYFSPQTRNYFAREFIESYRGMMALLLQSHLEFRIVTPRTLKTFKGKALILPDVKCLGESEVNFLRAYLREGNGLVLTGQTGQYNDRRQFQSENPVHKLLGLDGSARKVSSEPGARFIYDPQCPGKAYLKQLSEEFNRLAALGDYQDSHFNKSRENFSRQLASALNVVPEIEVAASPFVSSQIASVDGKMHVFLANFRGLKSQEAAVQIPERNVRISFPAKPGARVFSLPFLGQVGELKGEWKNNKISCLIPQIAKATVVWCE